MENYKLSVGTQDSTQVDVENGIIKDPSLMKVGEALGHGCFVDLQTLTDIFKLSQGNPVKAYLKHSDNPDPSDSIGLFSSLYIDQSGDVPALRAVQFQALKTWKESEPDRFNRFFELAVTAPSTFGVSMSIAGPIVWKMETGEEVPASKNKPQPEGSTGPFIRVRVIDSADFVSAPAANDKGLFSVPTKEQEQPKKKFNMKTIYEKYKDKEKALILAVKLSAESPDKTEDQVILDVEAVLTEEQAQAIVAENESLKAKVTELETQIQALTGEKTQAQANYLKEIAEALKVNTELETKLSAKASNGIKPVKLGVKSVDTKTENELLKRYYSMQGAEQIKFYRENEKELKQHFFN